MNPRLHRLSDALAVLALLLAACNAFCEDAPKPSEIRFAGSDGRILLSREGQPLAVLQIRVVGDAAAPVLSFTEAQKLLAAGTTPLAQGSEQVGALDFPLSGGGPKDKLGLLLRAKKIAAGARVLLTSAVSGPTLSALQSWKAPALEAAIQVFPDADGKLPDVLFIDSVKEEPHFEKPSVRRARTWSLENKKNFRVTLARSGPADWTVRSAGNAVLLTAPLLPDSHERAACGAFVLYLGSGPDDGVPEISPLKLDRREIPARDFIEGSLRVYSSGSNPFALAETAVVAEVACPPRANGEVEIKRLPCFFWEAPPGSPAEGEFRFRFAPPAEGVYGVRIAVVTATGQARGDAEPFRAGPPASAGFVKARENERFLRTDDGRVFVPLGARFPLIVAPGEAWDTKKFEDAETLRTQFIELARRGCNTARLMIPSESLPLENEVAGKYDAAVAQTLDDVFRAAQVRDIRLIVCLEQARRINEDSKTHPYFREMGGPLAATPEFYRDIAARRFFQNRLTYIAARYSAYRSVLAWELMDSVEKSWPILARDPEEKGLKFNEVDLCRRARRDVQDWAGIMGLHLKGMDQHGHPVCISTAMDPAKPWADLERVDTLDWILCSHVELDAARDEAAGIASWAAALRQPARPKKPFTLLEVSVPEVLPNGTRVINMPGEAMKRLNHNTCFAALATGLSAPPLNVNPADAPAAQIFSAALAEIVEAQGKEELRFIDSEPAPNLRLLGRSGPRGAALWLRDTRVTWLSALENKEEPAVIEQAKASLSPLAAGTYTVAWIYPWTATVLRNEILIVAPKTGGQPAAALELIAPPFRRDVLLFVVPAK